MKRVYALLLALCVPLAGCAKTNTTPEQPPAAEPSVAGAPAPAPAPVPAAETPPEDGGVMVYTVDGLEVPVPREYDELITADTDLEAWSEHWRPLISFAETASIEAGQRVHPGEDWGDGELCTLMRLDRVGFEEWASGDSVGAYLFARAGADAYYLMARPTDVRLLREDERYDDATMRQWTALNEWTNALRDDVIDRNGLTAYDGSDLFEADFTYGGEHVDLGCHFPGEPMDLVILSLSQPVRQGEGGLWCVERVRFVYSAYDWTDTRLVFPAVLGVEQTAADYYARLQAECDAGEHPELLTPRGAALDYARRDAWIFGEDVSASDFELIESVG